MRKQPVERKGYLSLQGFAPPDGQQTFYFSKKQVDHLQKFGPVHKYYEMMSAADVLKGPLVIFEGLNRDGKEKARCYVGAPKQYGDGWSGPGFVGMIFLVCLTEDGVVFEWRWEKADGSGRPLDAERRFTNEIWKV